MIVALSLLGYGVLLATAGLAGLRRAEWVDRAPRLAIAVWQALSLSFVASVVLGGLALSVPTVRVSTDLAGLLRACVVALRAQYAAPGGAALGVSGVVIALGVVLRCGYMLAATLMSAAAMGRRHRDTLALVGRVDPGTGAVIVDHDSPAAYCLPGPRRRIVLSSAALDALSVEQLRAVLAHERAHLRGRHDLVVAAALALERAFPRLPLFRAARAEIERLIELAADDAATRCTHRLSVAEALLGLAERPSPAGALAATGSATGARVGRLITGHRPLGGGRTGLGVLVTGLLLAVPVLLLGGPAARTAGTACCPMDSGGPAVCAAMEPRGDCPMS